jgi:ribosomal protein S17
MKKEFRSEFGVVQYDLYPPNLQYQLISGKTRDEWVEYLKDSNCDLSVVPWEYLSEEWSVILDTRPELAYKIDFKTMPKRDIDRLLDNHFMLIKDKIPRERMPKSEFSPEEDIIYYKIWGHVFKPADWGEIIYSRPEKIKHWNAEKITDPAAVGQIIRRHKRLAKYFSPSMLKRAQQYNAAWEKYQIKMKNKKRYNPGDIIEFTYLSSNVNADFCRRIKAFVIEEFFDGVSLEPMYTCVMLDTSEEKIVVHDEPKKNLRLIEKTNKTMLEYFGWDFSSIYSDERPKTVTITINDEFITNCYNKTWNYYDTSKQYLIKVAKEAFNLEYNKEYTLEVCRKISKNWYSVKSINGRSFLCPVDY